MRFTPLPTRLSQILHSATSATPDFFETRACAAEQEFLLKSFTRSSRGVLLTSLKTPRSAERDFLLKSSRAQLVGCFRLLTPAF